MFPGLNNHYRYVQLEMDEVGDLISLYVTDADLLQGYVIRQC
jgi:hypothetical protein